MKERLSSLSMLVVSEQEILEFEPYSQKIANRLQVSRLLYKFFERMTSNGPSDPISTYSAH